MAIFPLVFDGATIYDTGVLCTNTVDKHFVFDVTLDVLNNSALASTRSSSLGAGFTLRVNSNGSVVYFRTGTSRVAQSANGLISAGTRYTIELLSDGPNATIKIDGSDVATQNAMQDGFESGLSIHLGAENIGNPASYLDGTIHDATITVDGVIWPVASSTPSPRRRRSMLMGGNTL